MQKMILFFCCTLLSVVLHAQNPKYLIQTTATGASRYYSMCFDQDSNVWVGGVGLGYVTLTKWSRDFVYLDQVRIDLKEGSADALTEIFVDSNKKIVGCGNLQDDSPGLGFAFRYDPAARELMWAKKIEGNNISISGILEKGPGGAFVVYGTAETAFGQQADMLELNRTTGNLVPGFFKRYAAGANLAFHAAIYQGGFLYAAGGNTVSSNSRSFQVSCLDAPSLLPIWAAEGPLSATQPARMEARDLIGDGESIVTVGSGDDQSAQLLNARVFLQKSTLSGQVIWAKKYDLPGWGGAFAEEVVRVADGYVVYGRLPLAVKKRLFLLKTDLNGNPKWAKQINIGYDNYLQSLPAQAQMMASGNALFFAAYATDISGKPLALFFKTNLNGELNGCSSIIPTPVKSSPISNPVSNPLGIGLGASPMLVSETNADLYVQNILNYEVLCEQQDTVPPDPCQPNTFFKVLGSQLEREWATGFAPTGDGNLYLAGRKGAKMLLAKMAPDGQFLWVRSFDMAAEVSVVEIIVDSDGMIVGAGRHSDNFSPRKGMAFRYDPIQDQMLWARLFDSDRPTASGILEKAPNGNFIFYQNPELPGIQYLAEVLELDRNTGNIVPEWKKRYANTDSYRQTYNAAVLYKDALYVAGYNVVKPGSDGARMLLAKLSPDNGDVLWSKMGHRNIAANARFAANDLLVDQDSLVVLYTGTETPNGQEHLFLQKTDLNGNLVWARDYGSGFRGREVLSVPNGYVILGNTVSGAWLLVKTDKNGKTLFSKLLDYKSSFLGLDLGDQQQQIAWVGDRLFFAAYGYDDTEDARLLKTDMDLQLLEPCTYYKTIPLLPSTLVSGAANYPINQAVSSSTVVQSNAAVEWGQDAIGELTVCTGCAAVDSCAGKPDITFRVDSIYCSLSSGVVARVSICNLGKVKPSTGFNLTFYDKNPLTQSALALHTVFVTERPDSAQCIQTILPLGLIWLVQQSKIYTLVGVDDQVPTPVSLLDFPFPNGFTECNYANNLDSFELKLPSAVKPRLGPDRFICQGQTTVLDAGAGYALYQWLNGPASQTWTVSATGTYIAVVSDDCGRMLRDTVKVTVSPTFALTKNISFYPGDTVFIGGVAYTQSGTVVQNLTTMAGCDSVVINILQRIVTQLEIKCPADLTVTLPPNQTATVVDYSKPTATTDCPDPTITLKLLQGQPVGGLFPEGITKVCYEASNACGIRDTCCFQVAVQVSESVCDVKTPVGCIRYELLGIRLDSIGQRRYRVRITNTCASPLQFVYLQLPNGVWAVSPKEGAVYTASGGNAYAVRNPNASPFYSIRYQAVTGSLNNGKSDIFEYTLPQQSKPAYIHAAVKLADGTSSESHLNTFYCPEVIVMENLEWRIENSEMPPPAQFSILNSPFSILHSPFSIWPNPTDGTFFVQLNRALEPSAGAPNFSLFTVYCSLPSVQVQVFNAQGQQVLSRRYPVENEGFVVHLPEELPTGLYYLMVQPCNAAELGMPKTAVRFMLKR